MERNPFPQPDSSGNKDSSKKAPASFNVVPAPQFNTAERPPTPTPEQRVIPVAPAFEGVISWRDRNDEDMRSRNDSEELAKPTEAKESKEGDEEKKDGKNKPKQDAREVPQPQGLAAERPIAAPRPFNEVIAESQGQPVEKQNEDEADEPRQDAPENSVFAFPQPPRREYDPIRRSEQQHTPRQPQTEAPTQASEHTDPPIFAPGTLAGYPPVVPREESAIEYPVSTPHEVQSQEVFDDEPADNDQDTAGYQQPAPLTTLPGYAPGVGPAHHANFNQAPPVQQPGNPNVLPGGPNQPPANPNIPPLGGYNPNSSPYDPYNQANADPDYNAAPSAPIMPLERPAVAGANRDPRVGPVAALLGLEYLARKRADRKLEKRMIKRNDATFKQQERQVNDNAIRMQEQQRQFSAEQAHQASEMNQMRYAQEAVPVPATPRPFEAAPLTPSASAVTGAERPTPQVISSPNQPPRFYNNQPERAVVGRPMAAAEMRQQPKAEQAQQIQNIESEQGQDQSGINLAPHQHVEHSSWHNIVVDERGHEVQGAIEYGQGFQAERAKEAAQQNYAADSGYADSNAVTGPSYGAAGQQGPYTNPMLPSGMTNPTLPAGRSAHADPQHQLEAANKQTSNFTNPWFWIMLILIIAAFFTAALI